MAADCQTAMWLRLEQVESLDACAARIRRRTGRALNRSALVRALIDGLVTSDLDVSGCSDENELAEIIREKLATPGKGTKRKAAA